MARPPTKTLKAWRLLIDLCDLLDNHPGGLSSPKAAEELQKQYANMGSGLCRHFGTSPDDPDIKPGFPSSSTVLRYVEVIEEDLREFFPSKMIIPRNVKVGAESFHPPHERDVRLVRSVGAGLFQQLQNIAAQRLPLVLAASDSVSNFLLPRARIPDALQQFELRTRKYMVREAPRSLRAGEWDVAIGWDNGHQQSPEEDGPDIHSRKLTGSTCHVRLLFHPSNGTDAYRLAKKRSEYIDAHPEDREGFGFKLKPEDIRNSDPCSEGQRKWTRLLYPDLPQVVRIGERLEQHKYTKGTQLDHFASVASAVRMGGGYGLFFGIPWMMRELEHEHHIFSAGLELPEDWHLPTEMNLLAFTRKNDSSPLTGGITKAANALVNSLEEMLTNCGFPPPMLPPQWHSSGPAAADKEVFTGRMWHLSFVTTGKLAKAVFPRWMQGTIQFDAESPNGPLHGRLDLESTPERAFMDVWVNADALADGFLMLRFRRCEPGKALAMQTSAYFSCRITRDGYDGTCLLGSLNFAVENRPFSAPVLLSTKPLTSDDCRNVAHSHLLDVLYGNEPSG